VPSILSFRIASSDTPRLGSIWWRVLTRIGSRHPAVFQMLHDVAGHQSRFFGTNPPYIRRDIGLTHRDRIQQSKKLSAQRNGSLWEECDSIVPASTTKTRACGMKPARCAGDVNIEQYRPTVSHASLRSVPNEVSPPAAASMHVHPEEPQQGFT
jgi:hypothetical protein